MTLSIAADPIPLSVDVHGTVRVSGTRLTLDSVLAAFLRGGSPQDIVEAFPDLALADVYAIIAHYPRHRQDVDAYLAAQEAKAAEICQKIEARQGDQRGLRERLIARR